MWPVAPCRYRAQDTSGTEERVAVCARATASLARRSAAPGLKTPPSRRRADSVIGCARYRTPFASANDVRAAGSMPKNSVARLWNLTGR